MRGEIIYEYHRLNSKDQKVVRRWLWANIVVGATRPSSQATKQGLPLRML